MTHNLHIPLEIILQILENSIPPGQPNRIVSVSTPDIQLLVTWAKVCRATYEPATRFIRQHCVHIDSQPRLETFLKCLTYSQTRDEVSTLPKTMSLSEISSIYFGLSEKEIRLVRTNASLRDVLIKLGGSVRRLILDLPFRKVDHEHSTGNHIGIAYQQGLQALYNLEELVTLGGLPALEFWRSELDISSVWPKLRRVAGFKINLSEEALWYNVARHRNVEHLVVVMPYLLRREMWNIKEAIAGREWNSDLGGDSTYARPLKIVIAHQEYSSRMIDTRDGNIHDPLGFLDVSVLKIQMFAKRIDYVCLQWLIKAAKEDTLWK
ncbi:hypothetical protein ACHAO9_005649 [Fusarium lateritium]